MMRLLIAEDERVIRETICRMIDWKSNGIALIGACSNGLEAYDMIIDECPDIVLTDIRMPELDGLGLVERVRETELDVQFVIISGYSEFEYAKSAIKFGVCEYLLKPCDEDEILRALAHAAEKVEQSRESRRIQYERQWMASQFGPLISKRFTEAIIAGDDDINDIYTRYGKLLGLSPGRYYLHSASISGEFTKDLLKRYLVGDCLGLFLVKNTVFVVLRDSEDGAIKELSVQAEAFESPVDMLEALAGRLRRYTRVQFIDAAGEIHEINNRSTHKRFIRDALEFVEEHYGDARLTMKWLAENHLFMNADYLNRQFVQATGEKFSAYLGRVRVEKAKKLIAKYDSVYEVAEQVGCGNNPQYFSQLFKKWAGCTPSQYKEMQQKEI